MRNFLYLFAAFTIALLVASLLAGNWSLTITAAIAAWIAVQPVILLEIKRAQPAMRPVVEVRTTGVFAMAN